uniref:Uncharacterized protein n=1 Tax=Arundo donax TaxID=35708 RepID=A0A0A9CED1_ARUDO
MWDKPALLPFSLSWGVFGSRDGTGRDEAIPLLHMFGSGTTSHGRVPGGNIPPRSGTPSPLEIERTNSSYLDGVMLLSPPVRSRVPDVSVHGCV